MKEYLIYCFLDENKNPFYIGQTYNLKLRMNAHNQYILDIEEKRSPSKYPYYRKARKLFQNGYPLNIKIIMDNLTKEEADFFEAYYIKLYRNDNSCKLLNILDGGEFNQRNKFVSDETKRKISLSKKGKPLSEKHKESLRKAERKQKVLSNEQKQKLSILATNRFKGKKLTEEQAAKSRVARIGKKHTEETKAKIVKIGKDHEAACRYILVDPNGVEYDIYGLTIFCREHNLNESGLRFALKNSGKYKKWTIKKL